MAPSSIDFHLIFIFIWHARSLKLGQLRAGHGPGSAILPSPSPFQYRAREMMTSTAMPSANLQSLASLDIVPMYAGNARSPFSGILTSPFNQYTSEMWRGSGAGHVPTSGLLRTYPGPCLLRAELVRTPAWILDPVSAGCPPLVRVWQEAESCSDLRTIFGVRQLNVPTTFLACPLIEPSAVNTHPRLAMCRRTAGT